MRVIPVIDLKGGVVVRGVAGRRDEYRPIVSKLCNDPSPASVARGLREAFDFTECYVADLDAIGGRSPGMEAYQAIGREGFRLWIDAGVAGLHSSLGERTIVGLESLPDDLRLVKAIAWGERLVFSLDLLNGKPTTDVKGWAESSAEAIAEWFVTRSVTSMIVLDLTGVGVGAGVPTLDLCRRLRAKYPKLELVSGGGVRGVDDLKALRDVGCDATLVASALHDGRLTRELLDAHLA